MSDAKRTKADLETEVQELRQRVEKLEKMLAASLSERTKGSPAANITGRTDIEEGTPTAIVLAITAAVAAFLGKRATIHQIRLTGTTAWAMQGRATVQASHGISRWSR